MRQELPADIADRMSWFRMGCIPLPRTYINFHRTLAESAVEALAGEGYVIHDRSMKADGWLDGMMLLHVTIERDGKQLTLKWSDANQGWMRCHTGGGASTFRGI